MKKLIKKIVSWLKSINYGLESEMKLHNHYSDNDTNISQPDNTSNYYNW